MNLSFGWLLFLGGIVGVIRVSRASRISEISNYENPISSAPNDKQRMKPLVKILLFILNLAIAIGGASYINSKHNWNPFAPCPLCKTDSGAVS